MYEEDTPQLLHNLTIIRVRAVSVWMGILVVVNDELSKMLVHLHLRRDVFIIWEPVGDNGDVSCQGSHL